MEKLNKIAAFITFLSLLAVIVLWALGRESILGIPLIGFFVSLAISIRSHTFLKGLSFTILIFAAVAAAMFYPKLFTSIGGFSLKKLIVPLLMIIMFGMGTAMSFKDFIGVVKMPKGVIIGIICQFSIMPFVGYALASFSDLPPER